MVVKLIHTSMTDKVVKAYCVKCKAKRDMKDPKEATTKNGRSMLKGTCPECGTKMSLFVAGKPAAAAKGKKAKK